MTSCPLLAWVLLTFVIPSRKPENSTQPNYMIPQHPFLFRSWPSSLVPPREPVFGLAAGLLPPDLAPAWEWEPVDISVSCCLDGPPGRAWLAAPGLAPDDDFQGIPDFLPEYVVVPSLDVGTSLAGSHSPRKSIANPWMVRAYHPCQRYAMFSTKDNLASCIMSTGWLQHNIQFNLRALVICFSFTT